MSSSDEALALFKSWFSSVGGYMHPSVDLVYNSTVGVHLRLKEEHIGSFERGTLAISCPHSASLSALNAGKIHGETFPVPHAMPSAKEHVLAKGTKRTANGEEKAVVDSADSAKAELQVPEALQKEARPQFVAAVWVAVQYLLVDRSPWKAYIDLLPGLPTFGDAQDETRQLRGLAEIDTPLWWTEEERGWIQGTNLAKGVTDLEGVWDAEWRQWQGALVPWAKEHGLELTWSVIKYGFTILGSRAFSSAQVGAHIRQGGKPILELYDPDMLLYSGVDSLNHNPLTKNCWHSDDKCFGIVVEDDLTAGMEVFNPYGGKGNGELLLSYGFCLPDNPCDTYAIRLPPRTPQLLNTIHAGRRPHSEIAQGLDPSTEVGAAAGLSPMTPHNQPPPYNLLYGTYYVRPLSRHHLLENGYPSTRPGTAVKNHKLVNMRPSSAGLLGFPELLLSMLTASIVTPYERSVVEVDPSHYNTTDLWHQLGPRVELALCNLLLQRLNVELARTPLPSSTTVSQRRQYANTYLTGQRQILIDNINILDDALTSSMTPDTFLTFENALDLLDDAIKATFIADIAAEYGVELSDDNHQARTLIQQARPLDFEEDVWALLVGVLLHDSNARNKGAGHQQGTYRKSKIALSSWRAFVTTAYKGFDGMHEEGPEDGLTAHLTTVLEVLRLKNSRQQSPNLWDKKLWTHPYIAACAAVARAETFSLRCSNGSKLAERIRDLEQGTDDGDEQEKEEEEGESEIVVLYVGPAIEARSRE